MKKEKDLLMDVLSFLIGCVLGAIVLLPNFMH